MVAVSYIILILLCLFGYSFGVTIRAAKSGELKPHKNDLIMMATIWVVAVYLMWAGTPYWNKWFLILVMFVFSVMEASIVFEPKKIVHSEVADIVTKRHRTIWGRLWNKVKGFMNRIGSFQGRMILSLFFFIMVMPIALLVKWLADPLWIKKHKDRDSNWFIKPKLLINSEWFRRQF
jgi:hypothetical protein